MHARTNRVWLHPLIVCLALVLFSPGLGPVLFSGYDDDEGDPNVKPKVRSVPLSRFRHSCHINEDALVYPPQCVRACRVFGFSAS